MQTRDKREKNSFIEKLKKYIDKERELKNKDTQIEKVKNAITKNVKEIFVKTLLESELEKIRAEKAELSTDLSNCRNICTDSLQELIASNIKLQECQIQAALFANEAYINYSALYHTVYWQQSDNKENLNIARRHIVMCSILQQSGFLLLHTKNYRDKGVSDGLLLYRTAKYGQRIADMIFGNKTEFFSDFNNKKEQILSRLKCTIPIADFKANENLWPLLERSCQVVNDVKKNDHIKPYDKIKKAKLIYFRNYLIHQDGGHNAINLANLGDSDLTVHLEYYDVKLKR